MSARSFLISPLLILVPYFSFSQNVGIGTPSPAGKLQVNHRSNGTMPGLLIVDSTNTGSGLMRFRNLNSSKYVELWGFNGNSSLSAQQYLDVRSDSVAIVTFRGNGNVGINNLVPTERLDVNGNINLTGVLKLNGSTGAAGQVLTSNGTADPQWKNNAYTPNTRFGVKIERVAISTLQIVETYYNTNTADIVIGSDFITINRPGLYRFQGNYFAGVSGGVFANMPESSTLLRFTGGLTVDYYLSNRRAIPPWQSGSGPFEFTDHFSLEIHIPAPILLRVIGTFTNVAGATSLSNTVNLFCHLISE